MISDIGHRDMAESIPREQRAAQRAGAVATRRWLDGLIEDIDALEAEEATHA